MDYGLRVGVRICVRVVSDPCPTLTAIHGAWVVGMDLRLRRAAVLGALVALVLALVPGGAAAAGTVFTVTTTADTDDGACSSDCSLREAVQAAAESPGADLVVFADELSGGTLQLRLGQLDVTSTLRLDGAGQAITLDGGGEFRVLHIGPGAALELVGLTVAGGRARAVELGNDGGGILNHGTLRLSGSTVRGGVADGRGGGILSSGTLTLVKSAVVGNTAGEGGGIYSEGSLSLIASDVRNNVGTFSGGGISTSGGASIIGSSIRANSTSVDGGGVHNTGSLSLRRSTVSGNDAFDYGGGILNGFFSSAADLLLVDSTVSGNRSRFFHGGGIANFDVATLRNSTVSDNEANAFTNSGGGLWSTGALTIRNSIVAGNSADGSALNGAADCAVGGVASNGFNVVGGNTGCPSDRSTDRSVPPEQVAERLLLPLQSHGGPTQTHDLVFAASNPALDIGGTCRPVDQRGFPAPVDGPDRGTGVACDAGSVEAQGWTSRTVT